MLITNTKECPIRPFPNYVQIVDGWATYTDGFVLFRIGITQKWELKEPIYIHIDGWKSMYRLKNLTLQKIKSNTAFFTHDKGEIVVGIKRNIEYPQFMQLYKPQKTTHKEMFTTALMEKLVKQMKLEKKTTFTMEFNESGQTTIEGTKHLFMMCNKEKI